MMANMSNPATQFLAVTPSDTSNLAFIPRAVYVGVSGDLVVYDSLGSGPIIFSNVPVGWMPIMPTKILSAGTTASGIVIVR